MNKTVNINLAGIVFHIDETAFKSLKSYLDQIRASLGSTEGKEEIIHDVETRIAELFQKEMSDIKKNVVDQTMVNQIISILGQPEDYLDEGLEEESPNSASTDHPKKSRQYFRNPDDKIISGVCGGISAYFSWDPVIVRALFILSLFMPGILPFQIITYIILWIIVPEAVTTSDKLKMKGEPINFASIKKNFSSGASKMKMSMSKTKIEGFSQDMARIILLVVKAFVIFIGVVILIAIGFSILGFLLAILGFSPFAFELANYLSPLIFESSSLSYIGYFSLTLFFFIPLVFLAMLMARIIFKKKVFYWPVSLLMVILWISSIVAMTYVGAKVARYFYFTGHAEQLFEIEKRDFLNIEMEDIDDFQLFSGNYFIFDFDDRHSEMNWFDAKLHIKKSNDSVARLQIKMYSKGKNRKDANKNAQEIKFEFTQGVEDLILNEGFILSEDQKYRAQRIELNLYLPTGQKFSLDSNIRDHLQEMKVVGDFWTSELIEEDLVMTKKGVQCLTCQQEEEREF